MKHTNETNSDIDLNIFKGAVPQADVSHSPHEIDRLSLDALHRTNLDLSQKLAGAAAQRTRKQNLATICAPFLSPIQWLAPEILGEIFLHCLPSNRVPAITEAPLSLSQVCSAWREITISYPLLWAQLSFICRTDSDSKDNLAVLSLEHITDLWFERARNVPLTFRLHNLSWTKSYPHDNVLIRYANRFARLNLSLSSGNDILRFLTLPSGHVSLLQSLDLNLRTKSVISVFDEAPLLREVTLNSESTNPYAIFILPWHQLTTITMLGAPIDQRVFLKILGLCKQLVSGLFRSRIEASNGDILFGDDTYTLNNIIDFAVVLDSDLRQMTHFDVFNHLRFPSLTKFTLNADETSLHNVHLSGFLQRAERLQNLTLLGIYAVSADLLPVLQSTPHLTYFSIEFRVGNPEHDPTTIFKTLTYKAGEPITYLPMLEKFEVELVVTRPFKLDQRALIDMIESRQVDGSSMPFLKFRLRDRVEKSVSGSRLRLPCLDLIWNARESGFIEIDMDYFV